MGHHLTLPFRYFEVPARTSRCIEGQELDRYVTNVVNSLKELRNALSFWERDETDEIPKPYFPFDATWSHHVLDHSVRNIFCHDILNIERATKVSACLKKFLDISYKIGLPTHAELYSITKKQENEKGLIEKINAELKEYVKKRTNERINEILIDVEKESQTKEKLLERWDEILRSMASANLSESSLNHYLVETSKLDLIEGLEPTFQKNKILELKCIKELRSLEKMPVINIEIKNLDAKSGKDRGYNATIIMRGFSNIEMDQFLVYGIRTYHKVVGTIGQLLLLSDGDKCAKIKQKRDRYVLSADFEKLLEDIMPFPPETVIKRLGSLAERENVYPQGVLLYRLGPFLYRGMGLPETPEDIAAKYQLSKDSYMSRYPKRYVVSEVSKFIKEHDTDFALIAEMEYIYADYTPPYLGPPRQYKQTDIICIAPKGSEIEDYLPKAVEGLNETVFTHLRYIDNFKPFK